MRKRFISLIACGALAVSSLAGFAACGSDNTILIWGPGEHQEFLKEVMADYAKAQGEDYGFEFEFGVVSEADAYSQLNTDVKSGANVYAFANDQLVNLVKIGALARVDDTTAAKIKLENSNAAYEMGVFNGGLYAYPYSADNGFFMFYDSSVVKTDITDLNAVLNDVKTAGKKFIVEYTNSWYAGSMMYGAGGKYEAIYDETGELDRVETNLDQKPDGGQYSYGVLGAEGWATLARNEVVLSGSNDLITSTANEGNLGAVITGTWMAGALETAWGTENYAAAPLPQWTSKLDNAKHDWWTFAGGKLYGVNTHTDEARLAESRKIAAYLSSKEIQDKRFDTLSVGPSNTELAKQEKVTSNVALGALLKQMDGHAVAQKSMPQSYWDAFGAFGEACKPNGTLDNTSAASIETYITSMVAALKA